MSLTQEVHLHIIQAGGFRESFLSKNIASFSAESASFLLVFFSRGVAYPGEQTYTCRYRYATQIHTAFHHPNMSDLNLLEGFQVCFGLSLGFGSWGPFRFRGNLNHVIMFGLLFLGILVFGFLFLRLWGWR